MFPEEMHGDGNLTFVNFEASFVCHQTHPALINKKKITWYKSHGRKFVAGSRWSTCSKNLDQAGLTD